MPLVLCVIRMRAPRAILLLVVLCASWPVLPVAARQAPKTVAPALTGVRGLWVQRTSLTSAKSITAMVSAAKAGGFNTLLVQVRGRGEAFYTSAVEPRASELDAQPASFDPLALTIELAHAADLRVHAWVNVNLVASGTTLPRSEEHVALRHPSWLMLPKPLAASLRAIDPESPAYIGALSRWTRAASEQVEGLYLSPLVPEARAHTTAVVRELATRYALDGIHLDYIRFPSAEFDYSRAGLAAFRADQARVLTVDERRRLDADAVKNVAAWAEAFPAEWTAFRQGELTKLLVDIRTAVRTARPSLTVSAAVIPNADEARNDRMQPWASWAADGYLDVVCPMIYTTDAAEFSADIARAAAVLKSTPFWAGIGAYRLPAARAVDNMRTARRGGASGVLLFSYDSLTSAASPTPSYLSAIRPALLERGPGSDERD